MSTNREIQRRRRLRSIISQLAAHVRFGPLADIDACSSDVRFWFVRFVLKLVVLSLEDFSGAAPSLWIWFYAIAETPEAALASRESLIGELHRALVDERFTSFFEEERDDAERTYP